MKSHLITVLLITPTVLFTMQPQTNNSMLAFFATQDNPTCRDKNYKPVLPPDTIPLIKDPWWELEYSWQLYTGENDDKMTSIYSLAFNHDNNQIGVGFINGEIQVIDLPKKTIPVRATEPDSITAITFSRDNQHIAYGTYEGDFYTTHLSTHDTYQGEKIKNVRGLYFSHDDRYLNVVGTDTFYKEIDLKNKTEKNVPLHQNWFNRLAVNQNNNKIVYSMSNLSHIITCVIDHNKLFTLSTEYKVTEYAPKEFIDALAVSSDATLLALALRSSKQIIIRNQKNNRNIFTMVGNLHRTLALAFSPDNSHLACGSEQGVLEIFKRYENQTIQQILLNEILHLWLQCKKPDKTIDSRAKLLNNVATLFKLDEQELHETWESLSTTMQLTLENIMKERIQKYGI